MKDFDAILQQTRSLSLADRLQLARVLFEEAKAEAQADEIDAGVKGLAAWTESTGDEDWSEFYPATLRQKKVG